MNSHLLENLVCDFPYLVIIEACVLGSILLARNRAWPHRLFFIAHSSPSWKHHLHSMYRIYLLILQGLVSWHILSQLIINSDLKHSPLQSIQQREEPTKHRSHAKFLESVSWDIFKDNLLVILSMEKMMVATVIKHKQTILQWNLPRETTATRHHLSWGTT